MLMVNVNQFATEVNELKKTLTDTVFSETKLENMSDEEIILYKKLMKLITTSVDLITDQMETIDSINYKLDKLLSKSEA